MSTATVSTGALLSASTGRLVSTFDELHEAAEVLMGQPIFTHQFASEAVADQMAREAQRQHPWLLDVDMDTFPKLDGLTRDQAQASCQAWVAEISERVGAQHVITSPPETRHVPLLEGLPEKFGGAHA